jgi:hypothetical protein
MFLLRRLIWMTLVSMGMPGCLEEGKQYAPRH